MMVATSAGMIADEFKTLEVNESFSTYVKLMTSSRSRIFYLLFSIVLGCIIGILLSENVVVECKCGNLIDLINIFNDGNENGSDFDFIASTSVTLDTIKSDLYITYSTPATTLIFNVMHTNGVHESNISIIGYDLCVSSVLALRMKRKKKYEYTKRETSELLDIMIDSDAKLFVSAVGASPKKIADKSNENGILVMNMTGHPKHVLTALDIICAEGVEASEPTGNTSTVLLIAKLKVVDSHYVNDIAVIHH